MANPNQVPFQPIRSQDIAPFSGTFSTNERHLHANITKDFPTYSANDPRTWPVIHAHTIRTAQGPAYTPTLGDIPTGVVYTRAFMQRCLNTSPNFQEAYQRAPSWRPLLRPLHVLFRYWPFNFNRTGGLRATRTMSAVDVELWLSHFGAGEVAAGRKRKRVDAHPTSLYELPSAPARP